MWQLFSSTQGFLQKMKTKAVLEKVNVDDSNKRTKSDKIMMMMQALLLTIFIASFRKQSGRRMRKYGLVQPTDKQSGPYDDHPWHFWMLMMILILFYQAFFLSLIFHFWSIPLCLLWWNGFRSKTIIVNSFLIWVTFTFQHDLFFQNGGKNHYRSSVLLSESLSGVSPFSRQSVGCHLRIVGNWKHFQFRTKTFQQISQQLKAETKLIWINFPRYSIHQCWHIAVLYFSVIWIGKKKIKTEIQMSINKKTSRWATELHWSWTSAVKWSKFTIVFSFF